MSNLRNFSILALITILGAPLAAGAQTPASPAPAASAAPAMNGHSGHHHHESFMHALRAVNLTPAQQQQVKAFHDQEKTANLNADEATKKANSAKMRDQIMGILTPDQKTALATQMQHSHNAMGTTVPNPNPAASPATK